jgi:non-heme chloroperoxidase
MAGPAGSRFIEVEPGVRLWVEDVGAGAPMVFVHGWPASSSMFEYQFTELPKHGVRCLGIDARGFGRSDRPWGGYTYDRLAEDVGAVLEAFDLSDVTLVGFSMGGATAVRCVSRFGNSRIGRLALLGAAVPSVTRRGDFPHGIDREACDVLIRMAYRDRPKMIAQFAKSFFHNPQALSTEFKHWFEGLCHQAAGWSTIRCCELFRDADLRDDLSAVRVPTLILHGDSDQVCRFELAEQTQARITGSRLVAIGNAGHGFFYEHRHRVNEELLRFAGVPAQVGEVEMEPPPA